MLKDQHSLFFYSTDPGYVFYMDGVDDIKEKVVVNRMSGLFRCGYYGLGMISVKEVVWISLFLVSGLLLSKEQAWWCVFGMIPGIVFGGLSTKDTGQIINIELPLGIAIIGFFVGCGIGIYRKSLSKK